MSTYPPQDRSTPSRGARRTIATLALLTLLASGLALSHPTPAAAAGRGTYVLIQVDRPADLLRAKTALRQALHVDGVIGLSVRVPWKTLEPRANRYHFRVLKIDRRIAGPEALQIRFMAGRFTPRHAIGNSMTYDGTATRGLGTGSTIPLPFGRDGGPNGRFEREWKQLTAKLIRWAKGHRVHLVHLSWPGLLWAELALIDQMTRQPGYSYRAAKRTHLRLMDFALARSTRRLDVELPITGHAPNQLYFDITRHLLRHRLTNRMLLGMANLSDSTGGLAAAGDRPPPRRGAQLYGQSNTYDWAQVYRNARSIYAEYVEVYLNSFRGGTSGQLETEARRFRSG